MINYFIFCASASNIAATVAPSDGVVEVESNQLGVEFWKTKYDQLEVHCKMINEQKVTTNSASLGNRHFTWHMHLLSAYYILTTFLTVFLKQKPRVCMFICPTCFC